MNALPRVSNTWLRIIITLAYRLYYFLLLIKIYKYINKCHPTHA